MKKIFIILIILLTVHCSLIPAYSDYQQSLKDYSYQFEQYRLAHQIYSVSKNKYLSYKTPVALAESLESGKQVILLRDMVLITYFQALKEKLDTAKGVSPENLVTIGSQIDSSLSFLTSHKDKAVGTISLTDLTSVSKEVEKKQNDFQGLSKVALGTILSTRLEYLKNNIDKNQDFLSFTVSQNKAVLDNSVNMERWLIESKNKIVLAGQKIDEAKAEFNSTDITSEYSISENFSKGQLSLMAGNQYLKEALNFQKEVIRGITND
jgi:hypothetical protein